MYVSYIGNTSCREIVICLCYIIIQIHQIYTSLMFNPWRYYKKSITTAKVITNLTMSVFVLFLLFCVFSSTVTFAGQTN